jgi:hypothetical protein
VFGDASRPRRGLVNQYKSVAAQERQLRTKAEQLGINIATVYREDDGTSANCLLRRFSGGVPLLFREAQS